MRNHVASVRLLVAVTLVTTGCTGPRASHSTGPTEPPLSQRVPLVAPPEQVPEASLRATTSQEAVSGQTVYWSWIVDGQVREQQAPGVSSTAQPAHVSPGQPLLIELVTPRPPVRVQLLAYRTVGHNEPPGGKVEDTACVLESETAHCTYATSGDIVTVRATLKARARVIVLNAAWYVPSEMREKDQRLPSEVSAAWAFLVEPQ